MDNSILQALISTKIKMESSKKKFTAQEIDAVQVAIDDHMKQKEIIDLDAILPMMRDIFAPLYTKDKN